MKQRPISGTKKTPRLTRNAILKGMRTPPPGGDFVWDGVDEDERPVTPAEFDAARAEYRRKRGRPAGSKKVSTTIRFDTDVVEKFRARGRGWQSQMNAALREWLQAHESGPPDPKSTILLASARRWSAATSVKR